jgi:hypothetical protein
MSSDPEPNHGISSPLSDRSVLLCDPHRPQIIVAGQFLESQGGMIGIVGEQSIGPPGCRAGSIV